jgi:hypothetical protein
MFAWAACRVGHQCGGDIHNQTVRQAVGNCTIYLNTRVGDNGYNTRVCD